jgi:hypothetical protein
MRIASWIVAVLTGCLLVTRPACATTGSEDSAAVLHLRYVTVVVKDYDAALAWYTNVLGSAWLMYLSPRAQSHRHRPAKAKPPDLAIRDEGYTY